MGISKGTNKVNISQSADKINVSRLSDKYALSGDAPNFNLSRTKDGIYVASTPPIIPSIAQVDHLTIIGFPATAVKNEVMSTFTVEARNKSDIVVPDYTENVVISIFSGSGNLLGTLTRPCVSGVATFDDLYVDTAGDFVLIVNSGILTPDTGSLLVQTRVYVEIYNTNNTDGANWTNNLFKNNRNTGVTILYDYILTGISNNASTYWGVWYMIVGSYFQLIMRKNSSGGIFELIAQNWTGSAMISIVRAVSPVCNAGTFLRVMVGYDHRVGVNKLVMLTDGVTEYDNAVNPNNITSNVHRFETVNSNYKPNIHVRQVGIYRIASNQDSVYTYLNGLTGRNTYTKPNHPDVQFLVDWDLNSHGGDRNALKSYNLTTYGTITDNEFHHTITSIIE